MSCKLTSNSQVIYNSKNQTSGSLVIKIDRIDYQSYFHLDNPVVVINGSVEVNNVAVNNITYQITSSAWDTFFSSQSLSSTGEFDKQLEAALFYIKQEIDGDWGLSSSEWTYSDT